MILKERKHINEKAAAARVVALARQGAEAGAAASRGLTGRVLTHRNK